MSKLNKSYTSELDEFLQHFEKQHPARSSDQKKAIKKYQRINQKRDFSSPQSSRFTPLDFLSETLAPSSTTRKRDSSK